MRILPICYLEHLTEDEIAENECSDRIWLDKSEFEHWVTSSEEGIVNVLELTNGVQQTAIGHPYNVHHNEDPSVVYVPNWMYKRLDLDDANVTLTRFQPSLCTGFSLQPHTSDHLTFQDPETTLRNAFENYSCLMPSTEIPLWIGYAFYVTIDSVKPVNEPVCIRNCEVELDLLPPLDAPVQDAFKEERNDERKEERDKERDEERKEEELTNVVQHETLAGMKLGGTLSQKSHRELAAEAALRRFQKN